MTLPLYPWLQNVETGPQLPPGGGHYILPPTEVLGHEKKRSRAPEAPGTSGVHIVLTPTELQTRESYTPAPAPAPVSVVQPVPATPSAAPATKFVMQQPQGGMARATPVKPIKQDKRIDPRYVKTAESKPSISVPLLAGAGALALLLLR